MNLRAYARAKDALDKAENEGDVPASPAVDAVWATQHVLMDRKKARATGG